MGYWREVGKAYKMRLKGEELPPFDPADLSEKHRLRYEKAMADHAKGVEEVRAGQEQLTALLDAQDDAAVLQGPALRERPPGAMEEMERLEREGLGAFLKGEVRRAGSELREVAGEAAAEFRFDPIDWDARAAAEAHELPARVAARAPYRAPSAPAVTITRVPTRGKSQVDDLIAHLKTSGLAARPDLVHGVYRVPDRISPNLTPTSEKGRLVEWDIVHHPGGVTGPVGDDVALAGFQRREQWFGRRPGEPSVIDEDVGATYATLAGLGPEHCFGMPRLIDFKAPYSGGEGQTTYLLTYVRGIMVLHLPAAGAAEARSRMVAEAPLPWGAPEVQLEVLDWDAIRGRVQPDPWRPADAPSPLPYLPSTPQELLLAYLEIVGLQAADTYSAAVTVTGQKAFELSVGITNIKGIQIPCVDGKPRRRLHSSEHVVVSYRDRPEYVEGRARWQRYLSEVLFARLSHLTGIRPAVVVPEARATWEKALEVGYGILNPIEWLEYASEADLKDPQPFPYCWPPVG